MSSLPNLKKLQPSHKYLEVFKNTIIYSKEELLFHELQHHLTKLTSNKSQTQELSFSDRFQILETLKLKTIELKKMIDKNDDEENSSKHSSLIKLSHAKFVEDMI